ncbi:phenylacetate-CoA oxygenase/reductase subunit PaaK [Larkinella knui]|uniref:Ferredoxin--NADP reductase n=1 Tax=Larkinella knui TaxID=2025310 RepID=A0A3P1CH89_9BACT|nr:ferredoxin--NADP reductase [Larkinella knui]RRB12637.1 ferredoxin--NADP reductase [Larkinella knui]
MANRYFLKVKEVVRQTPDAVTIHFWHPINEVIRYQPGQYLTFILPFEGQKVRRSYSMSSSPHTDVSLAVTIKRLPGGVVSNYLCDTVKVNDSLETLEPLGTFVPKLDPKNQRRIILIGAGSGITPLISMAKSILHVEPRTQLWLLYGNRTRSSIIFENELHELVQQAGGRFRITHMLSQPDENWTGLRGRLNQSSILKLLEELPIDEIRRTEFYICGPDGLMDEARGALKLLNVPTDQVHKESFATVSPEVHGEVVEDEPVNASPSKPEVTVLYEGSEYKFIVGPHQTILEAALELDIDLPYSCQAGMCTACMGRCLSGKVHLDEEDGLAESELKAGYILTCVAHPLTNDVVIEIE